jgi:SAM-dependent methyltransferase
MSIALPFKFREIRRRFGNRPFSMLDVGAGNHSASLAKQWFPACRYAGIDRERDYHNDAEDFRAMDEFYELDLTSLAFEAIPDGSYDVLIMAHVIEHLSNGDEVLRGLLPKLKPGALLYLEFPGERSLHLPSMKGTLNFYDDDTHVRLFTAREVAALLESCGCTVLKAGIRRDLVRALLTPVRALTAWRRHGFVPGGVFWDLTGFADVVVAQMPPTRLAG